MPSKVSYCKQIIFTLLIIKIASKRVCFDVLLPVAQQTQKLIYFVCGRNNILFFNSKNLFRPHLVSHFEVLFSSKCKSESISYDES
jgi:hypothetical protein